MCERSDGELIKFYNEVVKLFGEICHTTFDLVGYRGVIIKSESLLCCLINKKKKLLTLVIDCRKLEYSEACVIKDFWNSTRMNNIKKSIDTSIKESQQFKNCDMKWKFGGVRMPHNPFE